MTISLNNLTVAGEKKRQKLRARESILAVLRGQNGTIDLASIIAGVLALGIIAGVIAATVFAVIPWSQDQAAQEDLRQVRQAENVYNASHGRYGSLAQLQAPSSSSAGGGLPRQPATRVSDTGPLLPGTEGHGIQISVATDGSGFIASAVSRTKAVFYVASANADVTKIAPVVEGVAPLYQAASAWDPEAASGALKGYLEAAGKYYKTSSGDLPSSPADLGYVVPAGLTIYNADNLASGQGLMNSGEGINAIVTDGTNTFFAGVAMVFPGDTNWAAPDYSTVTYTIYTPISALDTAAMTSLVGYGYITAPEIQYRTFQTLTALGIPDANGPGECMAGAGQTEVTCP